MWPSLCTHLYRLTCVRFKTAHRFRSLATESIESVHVQPSSRLLIYTSVAYLLIKSTIQNHSKSFLKGEWWQHGPYDLFDPLSLCNIYDLTPHVILNPLLLTEINQFRLTHLLVKSAMLRSLYIISIKGVRWRADRNTFLIFRTFIVCTV